MIAGSRPDPPDWIDRYPEEIKVFLKVRPGITGYSQAYFRNSVDSVEKMKNDAFYAENCTFAMDIKIFFRTIMTVLGHKNIYRDTTEESQGLSEVNQKIIEEMKKERA